jgi:hypothetical protein
MGAVEIERSTRGEGGGGNIVPDLGHSTSVTSLTTASLTASLTAGRKTIQPPARRKSRPVRPKTAPLNRDGSANQPHVGRMLEMELISNWGDPYHIGLTGFQFMDASFKAMTIKLEMMQLWLGDQRLESDTLFRLIDEETTTTDVAHMWCVPPPPIDYDRRKQSYRLVIDFQHNVSILGLVVWNYNGNANVEETYRGVKRMKIVLDGVEKSPPMLGTLIRKAPGSSSFNFGQFVNLNSAMVPEATPKKKIRRSQSTIKSSGGGGGGGGGPSRLSMLRSTPPREQLSRQSQEVVEEEENRVVSVTTTSSSSSTSLNSNGNIVVVGRREKAMMKKREEESTTSQEWGWSTSKTSSGSFTRRRDGEVTATQSEEGVVPVTTTTTTTTTTSTSIHQTSSDGLTLTEERDGEFDYGEVRQQYETPLLPTGCIFKFVLLSTHGDPHYVGLNGLELYDENNEKIVLNEDNVEASVFFVSLFPSFLFPPLLSLFSVSHTKYPGTWYQYLDLFFLFFLTCFFFF